jgi:hypothetical protein
MVGKTSALLFLGDSEDLQACINHMDVTFLKFSIADGIEPASIPTQLLKGADWPEVKQCKRHFRQSGVPYDS